MMDTTNAEVSTPKPELQESASASAAAMMHDCVNQIMNDGKSTFDLLVKDGSDGQTQYQLNYKAFGSDAASNYITVAPIRETSIWRNTPNGSQLLEVKDKAENNEVSKAFNNLSSSLD